MITTVIGDLKIFVVYLIITTFLFAMVLDVIAPNSADEYRMIGDYMGNYMTAFRIVFGDFDFGILEEEDVEKGGLN